MTSTSTLTYELHRLVWTLDKYADKYLQTKFQLSFSRFHVLAVLHGSNKITQHQIAEALMISDAVISRMIGDLAQTGYVEITKHPSHGRKHVVELTKAGQMIVDSANKHLNGVVAKTVEQAGVSETSLTKSVAAVQTQLTKLGDIK